MPKLKNARKIVKSFCSGSMKKKKENEPKQLELPEEQNNAPVNHPGNDIQSSSLVSTSEAKKWTTSTGIGGTTYQKSRTSDVFSDTRYYENEFECDKGSNTYGNEGSRSTHTEKYQNEDGKRFSQRTVSEFHNETTKQNYSIRSNNSCSPANGAVQRNTSKTSCSLPPYSSNSHQEDLSHNDSVDLRRETLKGIPNVGMTCYANSILQVLGQTPGLKEFLLGLVQNRKAHVAEMLWKVIQQLDAEGTNAFHRSVSDYYVKELLTELFQRDNSFMLGQQNDSHFFMLTLLERIRHESGSEEVSLFDGYMLNEFMYRRCKHVDYSKEQLFTSLLIPTSATQLGTISVEDGLKCLLQDEIFCAGQLNCRRCTGNQAQTSTRKRLLLVQLPENLVLQLGIFKEESDHFGRTRLLKDTRDTKYTDLLQIQEWHRADNAENSQEGSHEDYSKYRYVGYQLYGVVSHFGSLQGGHYTAYVKRKNMWYHCSDKCVKRCQSPAKIRNSGAFLLFYNRHAVSETK